MDGGESGGEIKENSQARITFNMRCQYTCLSILLATFNYRACGTFGPSMLNYSLNGAANAW